jgi:effector-binding domain-containing protein
MTATPEIVTRTEQPYAAIGARISMWEIPEMGARLGEVFAWLGARGLAPAGPPFFRYRRIVMPRQLDMEAGVPVVEHIAGDGNVVTGVLPAGRYAEVMYVGHPEGLADVTRALLDWADGEGLTFDVSAHGDGELWGCRLENYLTDPAEEPDMTKWTTQLAFRLADWPGAALAALSRSCRIAAAAARVTASDPRRRWPPAGASSARPRETGSPRHGPRLAHHRP